MHPIQRFSCKRNMFTSSFFIQQRTLCASHAECVSQAHCIRTMKTTIVYKHVFPAGHSSWPSLAVALIVLEPLRGKRTLATPRAHSRGTTQEAACRRAHAFVIHFKNAQCTNQRLLPWRPRVFTQQRSGVVPGAAVSWPRSRRRTSPGQIR